MKLLFAAALMLAPLPAFAQDVAVTSEIFVEKTATDANGKVVKTLEVPAVVTPGDPLVFKLRYANTGATAVENFKIVNPLPPEVSYAGTDHSDPLFSVDGGKNWGALAALRVKAADGAQRPATPADVTHVQFALARPIPAGGKGEVTFRGVVK